MDSHYRPGAVVCERRLVSTPCGQIRDGVNDEAITRRDRDATYGHWEDSAQGAADAHGVLKLRVASLRGGVYSGRPKAAAVRI
jgi:hypothetical protein